MPELPEVESIARKLNSVLPGKEIVKVDLLHPKTLAGDSTKVLGAVITQISRRAKIIRIHLDNTLSLLVHLKMTGQLIYLDPTRRIGGGHPTADWVQNLPSKHTRVVFHLSGHAHLFFNDQRLFGWIKVVNEAQIKQELAGYAPDINQAEITAEYLLERFKNRSTPIKLMLLDPSIVSGLGNIYVCDALNVAQIHPNRPANSLTASEVQKVWVASRQVIEEGIDRGGTTFDGKYVNIDGFAGGYQEVVRVYGREGKECLQCGGTIIKDKLGGRGTYYCQVCQV